MKRRALVFIMSCVLSSGVLAAGAPERREEPKATAQPGVVWFDVMTANLDEAKKFYGELFDWTFVQRSPTYYLIVANGLPIGGLDTAGRQAGEGGIAVYFEVTDVRKTLDKAESLGGRAIMEPMSIPGRNGAMAMFEDLEGHAVGLVANGSSD